VLRVEINGRSRQRNFPKAKNSARGKQTFAREKPFYNIAPGLSDVNLQRCSAGSTPGATGTRCPHSNVSCAFRM
jgi:hypothetical protein